MNDDISAKNLFSPKLNIFFAALSSILLLILPIIVFNGAGWYPNIVLFKWILTFYTVAYVAAFISIMHIAGKIEINLTPIEIGWFVLSLLFLLQPLFIDVKSLPEWLRSWFFFASIGAAIFLFANLPIEKIFTPVLRLVTLVGALSTAIGFAQQIYYPKRIPFMLSIRGYGGRFLANTGIDSLLGLYLAFAAISGLWLLFSNLAGRNKSTSGKFFAVSDIALLLVNLTGLWKTGSRSPLLACAVGLFIVIIFYLRNGIHFRKIFVSLLAILAILSALAATSPELFSVTRRDMSQMFNPETLNATNEGRRIIWDISLETIKKAPVLGVGLGNYKWHYMDSMAVWRQKHDAEPRYTYWAHNEFLQIISECGLIGASLLTAIILFALYNAFVFVRNKENKPYERQLLIWSIAVLAAVLIDSLFNRPFHHVDVVFFFSLALALISKVAVKRASMPKRLSIAYGLVSLAACVAGIYLFTQSFQAQNYMSKFYYRTHYIVLSFSEEREKNRGPILFRDIYQQINARQNFELGLMKFDDEFVDDTNYRDAIRTLSAYFQTQPRYDELNKLMLVLQSENKIKEAEPYFKYYPDAEINKFLKGTFDGKYMLD